MTNLPVLIGLEKLAKAVDHGKISLDIQVRAGRIVSLNTVGKKKTLYNTSEKDINTNQKALEYMIKRIAQQLESQNSGTLVFRVNNSKDKIKIIELESEQTIT